MVGVSEHVRQSTTFTALTTEASHFYSGSKLLQPIADFTGLPIDQVNFNMSLFSCALLAFLFRLVWAKIGITFRHLIELSVGIFLLYFCFGSHIIYVFGQSSICYLIMRFAAPRYEHIAVFVFCFAYLSATHIIRQIYDYGGYTLDVTLRFPSLLEFFSYTFYFQGVLVGPHVHYADYLAFIEGRNWTRFSMPSATAMQSMSEPGKNDNNLQVGNKARPSTEAATIRIQLLHPPKEELELEKKVEMPLTQEQLFSSSMTAGLRSMITGIICGFVMMGFTPLFPISKLHDPEFHANNSFCYKIFFMFAFVFFTKQRYLFAWKFSDAVNIFSGLSYSGITKQGKALWRLTDNIDIREFELGTRFAAHINAWNKTTATWLRFMVYDRAPWYPTLLTFSISALWHGFYPGYYIAFLTATLFLHAVRVVRSTLRPICEAHVLPRAFYDCCAFLLVRFSSAYMVLPYFMMTLPASYQVYSSIYFWPHVLALAAVFIVPQMRRFLPESMRQKRVYGRARLNKKNEMTTCDVKNDAYTSQSNYASSDDVDSGGNESDADRQAKPKSE